MRLTKEHLEQYFENGYVVVEGALTNDDLQPVIDDYTIIIDEVRSVTCLKKSRSRNALSVSPTSTRKPITPTASSTSAPPGVAAPSSFCETNICSTS